MYRHQYTPLDSRLGRHIKHDPRSRAYSYDGDPLSELNSVLHESNTPVLDQGNLGSCTGNAATKCLSYDPFFPTLMPDEVLNEDMAVQVYSDATKIDNYPQAYKPVDTGSDGLSVAKVLKKLGLISGYQHAFSMNALLTALSKQPVIVGTHWYESMFNPNNNNQLEISGDVAGGHEYVLDQLDMENKRIGMQNSWGPNWGVEGRAWLSWDDMSSLLLDDGDCTIFLSSTLPEPVPTPPVPQDFLSVYLLAANEWLSHSHTSKVNKAFVLATKNYLAALDEK